MARAVRRLGAGDDDRGSVLPMVLGMTLILLVLSMGIIAAGDLWLTHTRLLNRCEGAALAASYGADVPGHRSFNSANDAAVDYMRIRTPDTGVTVAVDETTVTATCWSTEDITFGWLFGEPTKTQTLTASALIRTRINP